MSEALDTARIVRPFWGRVAIAHRDARIRRLEERIAELENERRHDAELIADAVLGKLRDRLESW